MTEAGRPGPFPERTTSSERSASIAPGDPLKRVAWKASARRGEFDGAGVTSKSSATSCGSSWARPIKTLGGDEKGLAPLDHAIDEAVAVAEAHLVRGDQVGLVVCGARVLFRLEPASGPSQAAKIAAGLVSRKWHARPRSERPGSGRRGDVYSIT